jgi:hypothetical protein
MGHCDQVINVCRHQDAQSTVLISHSRFSKTIHKVHTDSTQPAMDKEAKDLPREELKFLFPLVHLSYLQTLTWKEGYL